MHNSSEPEIDDFINYLLTTCETLLAIKNERNMT